MLYPPKNMSFQKFMTRNSLMALEEVKKKEFSLRECALILFY
jgi:hypothetical protein